MSATPISNSLATKIRVSRSISLIGYALILVLLTVSTFLFPPPEGTSLVLVFSIKLLPLLIPLPGMLKGVLRPYVWLCFILLLYFIQAVLYVTQTQGHWLFNLLCALIILTFLAAMMHVHWSKKSGIPLNPVSSRPQ